MSKNTKKKRTYQHLSAQEREIIFSMLSHEQSYTAIAKELGRSKSTIMRERIRNCSRKCDLSYSGVKAHKKARDRWITSHKKVWIKSPRLRRYIKKKLKQGWSPEQIAGRIKYLGKLPSISYESIYQLIYNHRRDLIPLLPKQHKKRKKRGSAKGKRTSKIKNKTMIDQRPEEVDERNTFGHWEADTVVSRESKAALMVILERKTRLTLIRRLFRKTAKEMRKAVNRCLAQKPKIMKKTITFDNGTENAEHEKIAECLGVNTFFCNPYHSWEKGSVENVIGLIRSYLPKKTDFKKISIDEIKFIEHLLNTRPRKCLGFKTPLEVYKEAVALAP